MRTEKALSRETSGFFQFYHYHPWDQRRFIQLRMYTNVASFYPSVSSLARFHKPNTVAPSDKHTEFRGSGSNRGSVVVVALFKGGFQRDQAESPFCLIVHFLQCDGGRQDIFSSGSLQHYFCFIDFPIPNSQFVPLTLREGVRKAYVFCVCLCVLTPCVAQRSQILKQGVKGRGSSGAQLFFPASHPWVRGLPLPEQQTPFKS